MAKKIYDIKPPKVARKVEKEIKEFLGETKKPTVRRQAAKPVQQQSKRKKESNSKWLIPVGAVCVLLIVGVYLFFTLPKADILIWPKVETMSFQQTVTADKSLDSVDETKSAVPAQYFEASKTDSQDFPSTGSADNGGEASGTITIFNKYDPPTPFNFKAGTHFMSDSGKLFVAMQKIVIPAAKKSGGKIIPGSVQIQIQAVEGGDSYNIAPSNFSIPGLKGTPFYYGIYATSSKAMTGGLTGKIKKVNDDDIQGANDVMVKKATDDATSALKSQIPSDYVLLDNAISTLTTSASTPTKSGTVADKFNYSATIKASALAFKKSDLEKFAKDYISSQVPQGSSALDNTFKIDYSASSVDVSGGKATLNLTFSEGAYKNIDKNSVALSLLGKNADQINQTISSSIGGQVSKIKINFWPFWVTSAPSNQKSVNIQLKFQ